MAVLLSQTGNTLAITNIWLHSTIRVSIDDSVNILTPCSETIHTKFTKPAPFLKYHPCRLVSVNNNYMFPSSMWHYIP